MTHRRLKIWHRYRPEGGLSKLQRFILDYAWEHADERKPLTVAEIVAGYYGGPTRARDRRAYQAAHAAVSRAISRLEARKLVVRKGAAVLPRL